MYEESFLASSFSGSNYAPYVLYLEKDLENIQIDASQGMDNLSVPIMNDEFFIASSSNSITDSSTEVQIDSYEAIVIDRLNSISISAILSTCFLFLLLLHRNRG